MDLTKIPFIIGGLAILGASTGFFAKRFRPFFWAILTWCVQAPYVLITDHIWFTRSMSPPVALATVITIITKLTLEAIVGSVLVEISIPYIKRLDLLSDK